jgi:hypothetical protein
MTIERLCTCGKLNCNRNHGPSLQNRNNSDRRRTTTHWQHLSKHARQLQPWCSSCGTDTDLTVDLIAGGDHSKATLRDVQVLCRSCHSHKDGGRRFFSTGAH